MAELLAERRKANVDTARRIIKLLEDKGNFIPSSESVHREYTVVLLEEYRKYIANRSEDMGNSKH